MRLILALALLCAATIQASAQYPNGFYVDGNALMTWCEPRNAAAPSNPMCIGFVVGVSDAVNFSRQFTGQGSNTSCTPPGVTMGQEADVVLNYLNRNQDKRDLAAAALVVAAMDEAWCPQATSSTERPIQTALIVGRAPSPLPAALSVEDIDAAYVVKDNNGQKLAVEFPPLFRCQGLL